MKYGYKMIGLKFAVKLFNNLFVHKYKTLVYVPTTYALLQYMLLRPCRLEDTLFFIEGSRRRNSLFCFFKLPNYQILPDFQKDVRPIIFSLQRYWVKLLVSVFSRKCKKVYLSGGSYYIDSFVHYVEECIYLEDGLVNYLYRKSPQYESKNTPVFSIKEKIRKILFVPRYPLLGWADKVNKIYLTGLLPIPEEIAHKVELINLKQLWSQRSVAEQEAICRVFLPEGTEFIANIKREVMLLTQPYSEDSNSFFSEEEKIEAYRTILTNIDESTVLIKTHPRETTDYKKYFPQAEVLQTICPMELLDLLGLKVKKAITINSTSICNLDPLVEKVITGMHVTPCLHEEMIRRFKEEPIVSIKH